MIELITTAESVDQAKKLLEAGADILYIGENEFGLRLPGAFTREEIAEVTTYAHGCGKEVCVAVNALLHNDGIKRVKDYLVFLEKTGVDAITVGDPGIIHMLNHKNIKLSYWYDGHTMVTSSRQVNFWARRGAKAAVLSREIPFEELQAISQEVTVPVEVQVYGATCIQHSKRQLIENYFNFTGETKKLAGGLHIAEPKNPASHYAIFEDNHGTHVFATDDINLFPYLDRLTASGLTCWKLDGIFTPGENFVEIVRLYAEAKQALLGGEWSELQKVRWNHRLEELHPQERSLSAGFFLKKADEAR